MKYVAMDFETANASPVSACAIGISVFEDDVLLHSKAYLIRPPKEHGTFHWYNTKVHGIRRSMVTDAPTFDELWPVLCHDIEGSVLVCHNAMFDTAVLCKTLTHYGLPLPNCRYICTVKVSQKVWPNMENHKLDTVSAALGIALNHHEAGSDALACGMILQAALHQLECADADALADKIGMRLGSISLYGSVSCSTAQEIARQKARSTDSTVRRRRRPPVMSPNYEEIVQRSVTHEKL